MDKKARTHLFLERLSDAAPCASAEAALNQIAVLLNAVENEFTSIPFNPAAWESDGRLYPPQDDKRRDVPGFPDVRRYRSVGHDIWVAENGAIKISYAKGGQECLSKQGADGRTIDQLMHSSLSTHSSPASEK